MSKQYYLRNLDRSDSENLKEFYFKIKVFTLKVCLLSIKSEARPSL